MSTVGGVVIDAGLHETAPHIHEVLLQFRPRVAEMSADPDAGDSGSTSDVVIVGVHRSNGFGPVDQVRRLRLAAPSLGIFAVAKRGELAAGERQLLATVGVDRVLDLEGLSPTRLRQLIERRIRAPAPGRALAALSHVSLDAAARPLVEWALRNACYRLSMETAADVFWLESRTIRRVLQRHGGPTYGVLKALGLELHVLELEACRGVKRTDAAHRLGYRDSTQLSKLMGRDSPQRREEATWCADLRELYF